MKSVIKINQDEIREILAKSFNVKKEQVSLDVVDDYEYKITAEVCFEEKPIDDFINGVNTESAK